jgi:hypothetical protein
VIGIGPEDALRELFNYVEAKFHSKGYKEFLFLTPRKSYEVHPVVVMSSEFCLNSLIKKKEMDQSKKKKCCCLVKKKRKKRKSGWFFCVLLFFRTWKEGVLAEV